MSAALPVLFLAILAACGGGGGGDMGAQPASSGPSSPSPSPGGVTLQVYLGNLSFPVTMAFAPDGRLFFNELQTGQVRVVSAQGTLLARPFATETVETSGERGLLGLALHPDFSRNGLVYILYSDPAGVHRVVRYTDRDNVGADRTLLIDGLPSNGNHNGGNLAFGPDGMLYLTTGDSGTPARAQDPDDLAGKVLRFRDDGSVPPDNPFGATNPVYAMGLRNSFDLAFMPSTGSLYASENGPDCDDEINRILAGGNYGWRENYPCGDTDPAFLPPIVRFNPVIAPTGITIYQGSAFPHLQGQVLLVDFNQGRVRAFQVDDAQGGLVLSSSILLDPGLGPLLDIVTGPDGFIYISTVSAILRLRP
ncbi:MAG TPA: PQQ-dependent sugar dehydrogenase [Candidatus Nitrosotenuis sp.]|jgi:glucose/arabinose dehydrogenase|nr:PQQ-dependent sugar dehydrogenase [Candidatus Nitrosotenuis sp.]